MTVTANELAVPLKQLLVGVTVTLPELAVPQLTVMEVVLCPLATVAPDGTDQLYPVVPLTGAMEYTTPLTLEQTVFNPLIEPASAGFPMTVTASELSVPLKQLLVGVTVTLPELAVPQLTVIDVVLCPLAMVAPDGTVQL
jgi:hypothetical protein